MDVLSQFADRLRKADVQETLSRAREAINSSVNQIGPVVRTATKWEVRGNRGV